jgi:hypothetical protein
MWTLSRTPRRLTPAVLVLLSGGISSAHAQFNNGYPYPSSYYNNQSVQYGLNLPQAPMPNGADEVRAADGTTCRSNIAGNGPTLDMGVLGNQDFHGQFASGTVYGRVTVPLGQRPNRIDCTQLYQLELARMQHEIQLLRMGATARGVATPENGGDWQSKGWSLPGGKTAAPVAAPASTKPAMQKQATSSPAPVPPAPTGQARPSAPRGTVAAAPMAPSPGLMLAVAPMGPATTSHMGLTRVSSLPPVTQATAAPVPASAAEPNRPIEVHPVTLIPRPPRFAPADAHWFDAARADAR